MKIIEKMVDKLFPRYDRNILTIFEDDDGEMRLGCMSGHDFREIPEKDEVMNRINEILKAGEGIGFNFPVTVHINGIRKKKCSRLDTKQPNKNRKRSRS